MADLQIAEEEVRIVKPRRVMFILDMEETKELHQIIKNNMRWYIKSELLSQIDTMLSNVLEEGDDN